MGLAPRRDDIETQAAAAAPSPVLLAAHKGTISKWQINVAALKLAERQRKRKEGRKGMEGGRDEAKKPDERVEWRGEGRLSPKIF